MKKIVYIFITFAILSSSFGFLSKSVLADTFNQNNIMDDAVFDDYSSMTASQIQSFLGAFPNSCLTNYQAPYPTDYWTYGGNVPASTVIKRAADLWQINPKVILVTLEKEENLVSGNAGCDSWRYNSAVGMGCPDSGVCPAPGYEGFSKQVTKGMWQLMFNKERSYGNLAWGDNGDSWYYGFMTAGYRSRKTGQPLVYYDGYATIDNTSVYMSNGATAALYTYTPHFHGNQNFQTIFNQWFGSTYGGYSATYQSVENYSDNSKSVEVPANVLVSGQRTYMVLKFRNTGNVVWHNSGGGAVRLATLNTSNSLFCDNTWLSCNRPTELEEAVVNPGEIGTFEFWYRAPPVSYDINVVTRFGVVSEAIAIMTGTQQVQTTLVQKASYSATYQSVENYIDNSKTVGVPANILAPGQRTYMVLKFKNTGNVVWHNSGSGAVRLATLNTSNSPFCDSTWLNCQRPTGLKEATVNPGEIGTFEFWYKAPPVNYDISLVTRLGVVSEAVAIMTGTQQVQTTLVQKANYSATYQSVENYSDNSKSVEVPANVLVSGQRTYMVLKFRNTGNVVWHNSGGGAVRLATLNTSNSLFCDNTWLSCNRPTELEEAVVNPGEIGTFEFWYRAPPVSYDINVVTRFGVVSEAIAIMTGTQQVQTTLVQKAS